MKAVVLPLTAIGGRATGRRTAASRCKGLVITSATINAATGVVKLKGKLKCTGSEGIVHLDPIVLAQQQGSVLIKGLDEIGMDCGDPNSSFTVQMDADEGHFQPGKAIVSGKVIIGTKTIALCPVAVRLKATGRR